ncbi:hypothetical protein N781_11575 [Pontibacillus halophilus JSM 076056 = DSM 19796]|uniref:Uncharacterized protein n=1 Tax=Pontibacillus halophilus JSM 076056 = DSM 19796 TaxID=1385510 RepID=A0A0A5G9N4_9BACI|nr:hypothetical protein N781_11575 [Pontibacillus halophilus JSM 076056 = DSM 19796]
MKKALLAISVIVNLVYLINVLVDLGIRLSNVMNVILGSIFVISILGAIYFLVKSRQNSGYHPYLSLTVLTLSIASFAWLAFINYLSLIMSV